MILSIPLLRDDCFDFVCWWLVIFLMGLAVQPLCARFFRRFKDRGWAFSKVLGLFLAGFIVWALSVCVKLPFNRLSCVIVTIALAAVIWFVYGWKLKKNGGFLSAEDDRPDLDLILTEEILFIGFLLIWTYFIAFRPDLLTTEKFMDYGFMTTMMRSEALPAPDMWYAGKSINYYYGGHYFTVFLTKLGGMQPAQTYSLMRAAIASFSFVLPFSIVWNLVDGHKHGKKKKGAVLYLAGIVAGAAVSLAGNMHYVLYGLFGNVFKLSGYEDYWFPNSTRYIGHNPLTEDECIHEFPCYSNVLGDLHAHLINTIFVLLFIALILAWYKEREAAQNKDKKITQSGSIKALILSAIKDPYLWLLGVLAGTFQVNNFWDFVIYLTVAGIAFLVWFFRAVGTKHLLLLQCLIRFLFVLGLSFAAAIPFNLTFEPMDSGVGISVYHTAPYQFLILWGLPLAAAIALFLFTLVRTPKKPKERGPVSHYFAKMELSDVFVILLAICAVGLIFMPEVIYVIDIYSDGLSRCNTMFKLTYQAFIMFGMVMAYAIFRLLVDVRNLAAKIVGAALLFLLILTIGYFPYSVREWFGDVCDPTRYEGIDAEAFIEEEYPDDAEAIRWLQNNIEGSAVVLEAPGDSYSENCRVSVITGLPTVQGWYVHEWLWRQDPEAVRQRWDDGFAVYMGGDEEKIREIIEKYDIEYIFVGSCEREQLGRGLDDDAVKSLGEVVYESDKIDMSAYIVKVDRD